MCKAFSCIIDKNKKVTWKLNIDSHSELIDKAGYEDSDDCKKFVRIEISPKNKDYLNPNKWVFKIDEQEKPRWFSPLHEQACWDAFKEYEKQLYSILQKGKKIIHPFNDIKKVKKITSKHKQLLKQCGSVRDSASVWYSVRASVGDSVGYSVCDSVRASVGDSVRYSVGLSVRDSVWALVWYSVGDSVYSYIGSFFKLQRKQWEATDKIKTKDYPFQPAVDLWEQGLVPTFDGEYWRLHSGKNADVVFKIHKDKLRKL